MRLIFAISRLAISSLLHAQQAPLPVPSPPSIESGHWLGTDSVGRDILVRTLDGGRISLLVGLVGTIVSLLIGLSYGAISGYFGGMADRITSYNVCYTKLLRGFDKAVRASAALQVLLPGTRFEHVPVSLGKILPVF